MSRITRIVVAVVALAICLGTAESQPVAVKDERGKGPELGFNWRSLIEEHQALVKAGEAEKAVEFFFAHGKHGKVTNQALADDLKKKFSLIHGSGGKYDGSEIFGYKQISPRAVMFYALAHYEGALIQFSYGFERWNGEWKLHSFGMVDNMDEMARQGPFERITGK